MKLWVCALLLLVACGKPAPPAQPQYLGSQDQFQLTISRNVTFQPTGKKNCYKKVVTYTVVSDLQMLSDKDCPECVEAPTTDSSGNTTKIWIPEFKSNTIEGSVKKYADFYHKHFGDI